jgi:hypothetical protein
MCPHCGSENTAAVPWTTGGMFCRDCEGVFELPQQDDDIYSPGEFRELDKSFFKLPTHHPNV